MTSGLPHTIIAADWGKSEKKRRAVRIDTSTLNVEKVPEKDAACLKNLLALASQPGTLIAVDAVLGIPEYVGRAAGSTSFLDWLASGKKKSRFFDAVDRAEDWDPWRPFWFNPHGKGSQTQFFSTILARHAGFPQDHKLRRKIDRWVSAKPPTCVAGMPGTVGSGTVALWNELDATNNLAVWPFAGLDLPLLLTGPAPVLVEAYPALCYGIVLGESLPAGLELIAKTQRPERIEALGRLTRSPAWEPKLTIAGDLWEAATDCEDDFDALFTGLALYRMALEGQLNPGPSTLAPQPDAAFEGGIVGSWCVTKAASGRKPRRSKSFVAPKSMESDPAPLTCPLPGCGHPFRYGRGGWDAHIASLRKHPEWHPEIRDGDERKKLFRSEFPEFFDYYRPVSSSSGIIRSPQNLT